MKKRFILILSLFFSMSLSMPAFAAETTTPSNNTTATENYRSYAHILPGSIFYSIDEVLDNLSVKFANTPSDKIEKLLKVERERLGDIQVLIDSKKTDLGLKTLNSLKTLSDETSTEISSILNDSNTSEAELKTLDTAIKDVEKFNANSADALNALKNKLSKNAFEKFSAVAEMQAKRKEAVKQMVTARHELNNAKKAVNTAKKALAKAIKSGDSAAIEKAKADLAAANITLSEKKTAFENAKKNKHEVIKNTKLGKDKNAAKNKDANTDENTTNTATENNSNIEKDTNKPTVTAPSPTIENASTTNAENAKKSDNDKVKKDKSNNENNVNHDKKGNNK